jgi:purine-nucleoside phosphorylase
MNQHHMIRETAPRIADATLAERYGTAAAERAANAIRAIAQRPVPAPAAVIVLGSGLGGLADVIGDPIRIPYHDIPGFPPATVEGHAGALILGTLAGKAVLCLAGRFHLYEGHSAQVAAFPIRVAHALGARVLIVSNAAGGIRRAFGPGTLMRIADHINLMDRNPLTGPVQPTDVRFPDMSAPYDADLGALLEQVAHEEQVPLAVGVYCGLLGPTYETPAEVRMLEKLGGDATGMSTVPEVIAARAMHMRVVGVSLITNAAAGYTGQPLNHAEVMEVGAAASARFQRLISAFVARLAG